MLRSFMLLLLVSGLSISDVSGEVELTSESGFVVTHHVVIVANRAAAWESFLQIGNWWESDHTWSGDAKNLSLSTQPGGLFRETLPDGGWVEHMRVISVMPKRVLRLSGALGPLQEHPVRGVMTVTFRDDDEGQTRVDVTYRVSGELPGGAAAWSDVVDRVIGAQFTSFRAANEPDAA